MALCLAESLVECKGYDGWDFGRRLVRWIDKGENSSLDKAFDVGSTTIKAIAGFKKVGPQYCGKKGEWDCGNGSIIRLAPIVIFYYYDRKHIDFWVREQGRVTHAHSVPLGACSLLCALLVALIETPSKSSLDKVLQNFKCAGFEEIVSEEFKTKARSQINSSGYVVHTLEAALWALWNSESFEEALLLAVNLGEDSDSVGAVTGQLAGALYGYKNIPNQWSDELYDGKRLLTLTQRLINHKR